jgi:phytoene dehydrogenase-like protein
MASTRSDVLIIGGGHNGLVAALMLARRNLKVTVLERREVVGGAAVTEHPFKKAPRLGHSTGSYLFGLMPPELLYELDLNLKLHRRDPHYFLPTTSDRHLLFGSNEQEMEKQFRAFFSEADWLANQKMNAELAALRNDLGTSWLEAPLSMEATAEKFVRKELRKVFIDLCRGSARNYLDRFGFKSDLVKAMYAVTDGFSGVDGGYDTPGVGLNFLIHSMCRLPGSGGTWMIVEGGMGAITQQLAEKATRLGASIRTNAKVAKILVDGGVAKGVVLENGDELHARVVMSNADPFATMKLLPDGALPKDYTAKLDGMRADGSTLKVNMALRGLPKFTCLPDAKAPLGATIHLLPEGDVLKELDHAYQETKNGRLPRFPSIEWYIHTAVDPTLSDPEGHHSSALFVEWVPYELSAGKSWEQEEAGYVKHLLSICDRFAPGFSDLVVETMVLTPKKIESHFGITRGHIHHVDNKLGFDQRLPYATPIDGLFYCGAGCHPAGAVIGAAGHNGARTVLKAMGLGSKA